MAWNQKQIRLMISKFFIIRYIHKWLTVWIIWNCSFKTWSMHKGQSNVTTQMVWYDTNIPFNRWYDVKLDQEKMWYCKFWIVFENDIQTKSRGYCDTRFLS